MVIGDWKTRSLFELTRSFPSPTAEAMNKLEAIGIR